MPTSPSLVVDSPTPSTGTPLSPDFAALWATMEINPIQSGNVKSVAQQIVKGMARYQAVTAAINTAGGNIIWQFIGLVHYMECTLSWNHHLYNGDPLTARTVRYPPGRPIKGTPPFTWEFSTQSALTDEGLAGKKDWSIPGTLATLERYNGLGYRKLGIYSPYLWSMTNHYTSGKYIEVLKDPENKALGYKSVFNAKIVSNQMGAAALLKYLSDASLGVVTTSL